MQSRHQLTAHNYEVSQEIWNELRGLKNTDFLKP